MRPCLLTAVIEDGSAEMDLLRVWREKARGSGTAARRTR
jgi:hypothetical protein